MEGMYVLNFFAKWLWQFKICTFNEKLAPRPLELTQVKQPYLKITVNFEINISEIKQRDCLCVRLLLTSKDWREVSWQHFDHPTSSVLIYISIILVHLTLKSKEHCDLIYCTQMTRAEAGKIKKIVINCPGSSKLLPCKEKFTQPQTFTVASSFDFERTLP